MFFKKQIKISLEPRLDADLIELAKLYPITPSSKSGRSWWKDVKSFYKVKRNIIGSKTVDDIINTFKYCPAVFDFTNSGYMVRWIHDIEFYVGKDGIISWQVPEMIPLNWISAHTKQQTEGCPIQNESGGDYIIKVNTPFVIETPKNWSVLFCKPFYSFDNYFDNCPGILDADKDKYSCHAINVFFRFNVKDKVIRFKAGDPMIQLLPFKRIPTKLEFNEKPSKKIVKQHTHRLISSMTKFSNSSDLNETTLLKYRDPKIYE